MKQVYNSLKEQLTALYPPDEARAIALRLIEHFTGMGTAAIMAHPEKVLDNSTEAQLMEALEACLLGAPLQYVLGETEFYGYRFKVTNDVLIPRPETEELVDWIVKDSVLESPSILDIGTGSGCIAISLACALPLAKVTALDVSENALLVAQGNAKLNNAQVQFVQQNILLEPTMDVPRSLDVIVSNPPYVCHGERALMRNNVLQHEPHLALFVTDERPLVFYEAIARLAQSHLSPNGVVYVEINENFGPATVEVFQQAGFNAELRKDLFGRDRMVKAYVMQPKQPSSKT